MIETRRLKIVVIFFQRILSFVLSRKIHVYIFGFSVTFSNDLYVIFNEKPSQKKFSVLVLLSIIQDSLD